MNTLARSNRLRWNQLSELENLHSPRSLFSRYEELIHRVPAHVSRRLGAIQPNAAAPEEVTAVHLQGQQSERIEQLHWPEGQENVAHCIPLVDISEGPKEYLIKADLPQVKKGDVKLIVGGGTLTITGDRKFKKNSKRHHRVERTDGRFVHSFWLPDDATPPEVTAEFNAGVLKVHLAKNEKARTQPVEAEATAYDPSSYRHWGINE